MKKILMAVVLAGVSGVAGAADFSDLQSMKAADIGVSAVNIPAPQPVKSALPESMLKGGPAVSTGVSPYCTLKQLFDSGAKATPADLYGWYSGRMVSNLTKDKFEGTLLMFEKVDTWDGGPLFSENGEKKYRLSIMDSDNPDAFDILDAQELEAVRAYKNQTYLEISLDTAQVHPVKAYDQSYEFRVQGDYIISKRVISEKNGKEIVVYYSYYFLYVKFPLPRN